MAKKSRVNDEMLDLFQERLAELELVLEDMHYVQLMATSEREFSKDGIDRISRLSRVMSIKNPLIKRGIEVTQSYVWGQGMTFNTNREEVTELLMQFWDHPENRKELTHLQSLIDKEQLIHTDGNIFLVLVVDAIKGKVIVRSLPLSDIHETITDPNDRKTTWYYVRRLVSGEVHLYPHWSFLLKGAANNVKLPAVPDDFKKGVRNQGTIKVQNGQFVYHIRKGGFADWKFSVPTVYAAIDWSKAYKEFLEDWLSIVRAYRKYAWKVSTPDSQTQKATRTHLRNVESTPPVAGVDALPPSLPFMPGATAVTREGTDMEPMRTAGATIGIDDGRRIMLMICAAFGLPETFFGDVSVGTLATADSLDRPTELKFRMAQEFWKSTLLDIFNIVIAVAWRSTTNAGPFKSILKIDAEGLFEWNVDPDFRIDIEFPPIVVGHKTEEVAAVTAAAPYLGDPKYVQKLLLVALGEDDLDEVLDMLPEKVSAMLPAPKIDPNTGQPVPPPLPAGKVPPNATKEALEFVLRHLVEQYASD